MPVVEPPPPAAPAVEEEVVVRRRPPPTEIWPWLVAALFAALALVFFLLWLHERSGPKTSRVPGVEGLQRPEAESRIRAAGFDVKVKLEGSTAPSGSVLEQAPQPRAVLSRGSRVYLAVSRGAATITTPKVTGLRADGAERILRSLKLVPQRKVVPSGQPKDLVLSQTPTAGEKVAKGTIVFFNVSRGPRLVVVPALRGLTLENATARAQAAGLVAVAFTVTSAEPNGTVVAQSPQPQTKVKAGSNVRINVSNGGAAVTTGATTTVTTVTTTATTTTTP